MASSSLAEYSTLGVLSSASLMSSSTDGCGGIDRSKGLSENSPGIEKCELVGL